MIPVLILISAILLQHVVGAIPSSDRTAYIAKNSGDGSVDIPGMDLTLRPINSAGVPTAINITMRLHATSSSRFAKEKPVLQLPLRNGVTPTARYDDPDDILAWDDLGHLPLKYQDRDNDELPRLWFALREPKGNISFNFVAPHRKTDEHTPVGPRIDLRLDLGGGLVGEGSGFIPLPPVEADTHASGGNGPTEGGDDPNLDPWRLRLRWDLSDFDSGIKAASSHGDEEEVVVTGSLAFLISQAIFAVGPLQRYPPWVEDGGIELDHAVATYWIDPSPLDMIKIAKATDLLSRGISRYFNRSDPFRLFARRVHRGNGGTGGTMSFILEYDNFVTANMNPLEITKLLAHEIVHSYALLDHQQGYVDDWWYNEGVADYLSATVGYTSGGWDHASLLKVLNDLASAYYTSPVRNVTLREAVEYGWENVSLLRVPYYRGFIHFVRLHGLISEATQQRHGIDEIIKELASFRVRGAPYGIKEFRGAVSRFIDGAVEQAFHTALHKGDLIAPPANALIDFGITMVRKDVELFELGFDLQSFDLGCITGLDIDSRAGQGGVREGDKILWHTAMWSAADSLDNSLQLRLERDGVEMNVTYWPRSHEKVEAYTWMELPIGTGEL